jgi:hypothetical protein
MRVFVAFGYRPEERWVRDLVLPILDALEIAVVDGQETRGKPIDQEVRQRIASADAVLGFLLRREKNPDGSWTTSEYVRQELEIGLGQSKDVIQVVESDVPSPGGFFQGLQRLSYDASARDEFLVQLTKHLREWVQGTVFVRLAPAALVNALAATASGHACSYEILHQGRVERSATTTIVAMGGGLYVKLAGFRPERYVNLTIDVNGKRWSKQGVPQTFSFVTIELS